MTLPPEPKYASVGGSCPGAGSASGGCCDGTVSAAIVLTAHAVPAKAASAAAVGAKAPVTRLKKDGDSSTGGGGGGGGGAAGKAERHAATVTAAADSARCTHDLRDGEGDITVVAHGYARAWRCLRRPWRAHARR